MTENTRNEVARRVTGVLCETLAVSPSKVTDETRVIEDLGADSLAVVTLMIALDDEFDVELDVDEVPKQQTSVGWIIDYIAGKVG